MNIRYDYLRPGKARLLEERYALFAGNLHPLRLSGVDAGLLLPPPHPGSHDCAVAFPACGNRLAIEPLSCEPDAREGMLTYARRAWHSAPQEDITVLYGGYLNPHWGHFIMDSLSRLWPAYLDAAPDYDAIVFATDPGVDLHSNILQTLRLAGLMDRIRFVDSPTRFSRVIVPEAGIESRDHYGAEVERVYEAVGRNVDALGLPGADKRVYMSRSRLKKARLNEPGSGWVDSFFKANGYTVIYPEQMEVAELIAALRGADTVAALSGTLPHNLVFARRGTRLTVIEKGGGINNYQQAVDLMRDLDATYVDANATILTTDPGLGPFIIYPNHLMLDYCTGAALTPPAEWSPSMRRSILRRFFSLYGRHYGREWILPQWMECEISVLREAYEDSCGDFGRWLRNDALLMPTDWLSPRAVVKSLLRFLRR